MQKVLRQLSKIVPYFKRITTVSYAMAVAAAVGVVWVGIVNASTQNVQSCTQDQVIAKGKSPAKKRWTVSGRIRANRNSCQSWLFEVNFSQDRQRGSFGWGWGIPTGGSLPTSFIISSRDEYEGPERVFAGVVGAQVASIILTMSDGTHLQIRPVRPATELRKKLVWLRNMRYFVQYYPVGVHVKVATVRSAQSTIAKVEGEEGAFAVH